MKIDIDPDNESWVKSGTPSRIRQILTTNIVETKAIKIAKDWLESRSKARDSWCMVLSAGKGSGKSVAAGYVMAELGCMPATEMNCRGYGIDTQSWWQASKFARLSGYDGIYDRVCNSPHVIVVDDIGTEFLDRKGWFLQAMDAFVDSRYSEFRPTIFTTNMTAKAFRDRYSERVIDRIREGGSFFEFSENSLRVKP